MRKGNHTKTYIVSILRLRMLCFLRIANSGYTSLTMQPDVFVENCCETTRFRRLWMGSGVSLMSLPAMWGPCLFGTSWDYIDYRGDVTTCYPHFLRKKFCYGQFYIGFRHRPPQYDTPLRNHVGCRGVVTWSRRALAFGSWAVAGCRSA